MRAGSLDRTIAIQSVATSVDESFFTFAHSNTCALTQVHD